jgi:hypothetical protein
MKKFMLIAACLVALGGPASVAAQTGNDRPKTTEDIRRDAEAKVAVAQATKQKTGEMANPRFVRTLTNVQVELTLTDQLGGGPAEKKSVSMIVATGTLGKVRTAGTIRPQGDAPYPVMLNVDARPFVSAEGTVQLELTLEYYPLKGGGEEKEGARQRPSGINQSQTVVLPNGRPLIISQAADPISDRKVVVEVKATVLK